MESALRDRFDPLHKIEYNLPKGHSLFNKLVQVAKLDDTLTKWAEQIKDCGDWAAHSNVKFQTDCESRGRVQQNLDGTRLIWAALYPKKGDAEMGDGNLPGHVVLLRHGSNPV